MAGGQAEKDSGKAKTKAVSCSWQQAGLQLPVVSIHHHLKSRTTSRGHAGTAVAVCIAAILEYLTAKIYIPKYNLCSDYMAFDNKLKIVRKTHQAMILLKGLTSYRGHPHYECMTVAFSSFLQCKKIPFSTINDSSGVKLLFSHQLHFSVIND
ncbi:LOW QUALITY PROTEIN: histone H2A.Z-like [Meriones unguiculatus]|uniref:LOW QUALITY PROTEIN: histone H2A.Z-like n=1 Tax=Meriones unguiculatus TaxID=10047 RepID=UPI00293F620C|nr:LOW QUALITY PROTEIN: histone H2A.Z-like [Meriones unguiculatus]